MTNEISVVDRFDKAVEDYAAFRTRYAPDLLDWILTETGTGTDAHILDLGCGPGFIANAIAPKVARVTGVDPSPNMLLEAKLDAPSNVTYLEGSSENLSIIEGPIDLVTMGRSFHWMDRPATLLDLDQKVTEKGALAFVQDKPIKAPMNDWWYAVQEIGDLHKRPDPCSVLRKSDQWVPHEIILLASPFCELRRISVLMRHTWTFESLMGNFLSRSTCTEEVLGAEGRKALERALDDLLASQTEPPWETLNEHTALIARRPE